VTHIGNESLSRSSISDLHNSNHVIRSADDPRVNEVFKSACCQDQEFNLEGGGRTLCSTYSIHELGEKLVPTDNQSQFQYDQDCEDDFNYGRGYVPHDMYSECHSDESDDILEEVRNDAATNIVNACQIEKPVGIVTGVPNGLILDGIPFKSSPDGVAFLDPRARPVSHPAEDPPACSLCVRKGSLLFNIQCDTCWTALKRGALPAAQIFAVLRQWDPRVQRNIGPLVALVSRKYLFMFLLYAFFLNCDFLKPVRLKYFLCPCGSFLPNTIFFLF
jgi:hypothetical protein